MKRSRNLDRNFSRKTPERGRKLIILAAEFRRGKKTTRDGLPPPATSLPNTARASDGKALKAIKGKSGATVVVALFCAPGQETRAACGGGEVV